jgi:hypothetical protein
MLLSGYGVIITTAPVIKMFIMIYYQDIRKSIFGLAFVLLVCNGLFAQPGSVKDNPFYNGNIPNDSAFWQKVTVEQMLCLPPIYQVEQCWIIFVISGQIFYIGYLRGYKQTCMGSWDAVQRFGRKAKRGDKILISDIRANKEGREMKLAEKAILFK